MAEMGAQVLQAEAPTIACQTRGTLSWSQNHRNEYSITVNTAKKSGQKIFLKCIEWADIWIEAGRPGSYAKRGLTDKVCWEHNKALTIVHVSGYGQFGPSKDKPSYDVSGQAMGGYMYMNGVSPTSGPMKVTLICLTTLQHTMLVSLHYQDTSVHSTQVKVIPATLPSMILCSVCLITIRQTGSTKDTRNRVSLFHIVQVTRVIWLHASHSMIQKTAVLCS